MIQNNAMINANDTKNGVNGVDCGVNDAGNGINGVEVPLNKEQAQIEKLLQIIQKFVCNTGILCRRDRHVEKNGFSNVCFFTGKRHIGTERNKTKSKLDNYKVGGAAWIETK